MSNAENRIWARKKEAPVTSCTKEEVVADINLYIKDSIEHLTDCGLKGDQLSPTKALNRWLVSGNFNNKYHKHNADFAFNVWKGMCNDVMKAHPKYVAEPTITNINKSDTMESSYPKTGHYITISFEDRYQHISVWCFDKLKKNQHKTDFGVVGNSVEEVADKIMNDKELLTALFAKGGFKMPKSHGRTFSWTKDSSTSFLWYDKD